MQKPKETMPGAAVIAKDSQTADNTSMRKRKENVIPSLTPANKTRPPTNVVPNSQLPPYQPTLPEKIMYILLTGCATFALGLLLLFVVNTILDVPLDVDTSPAVTAQPSAQAFSNAILQELATKEDMINKFKDFSLEVQISDSLQQHVSTKHFWVPTSKDGDSESRYMHFYCMYSKVSSSKPTLFYPYHQQVTVLFDAAIGQSFLDYVTIQKHLTSQLSSFPHNVKRFSVCSFDRLGYGWSSPIPEGADRSPENIIDELLNAIEGSTNLTIRDTGNPNETEVNKQYKNVDMHDPGSILKPPYLFVGHSNALLNAAQFMSKTRKEYVRGVLLLDPSKSFVDITVKTHASSASPDGLMSKFHQLQQSYLEVIQKLIWLTKWWTRIGIWRLFTFVAPELEIHPFSFVWLNNKYLALNPTLRQVTKKYYSTKHEIYDTIIQELSWIQQHPEDNQELLKIFKSKMFDDVPIVALDDQPEQASSTNTIPGWSVEESKLFYEQSHRVAEALLKQTISYKLDANSTSSIENNMFHKQSGTHGGSEKEASTFIHFTRPSMIIDAITKLVVYQEYDAK